MRSPDLTVDEAAEAFLVAHQRHSGGACLCGYNELGRSHARHQAAVLREAGLLAPAGEYGRPVRALR